ncbi:exonuclease SbcCD subunit D [Bombilactobacillus bombi]|uniref:exonuclease SbcCD subunit D n=1 Tax=Bombilactobacillus bombi TaxID=1303590 RepID=UPI0015E5FE4C|nr:exonuclease SbcCD subunit D [Bombilactobacillus bombi]MBA1433861.1 exonuclease SbcCD subunit D [Bombilactobacillus bombi]
MRLLHTADWHIGRRLHGFDLTAEQQQAFEQIESIAQQEQVDGLIIAGDLYDRSAPAEAAVRQLNQMLQQLNLTDKLPIYAISGNHDSSVRLATGTPWFPQTNFYLYTDLQQAFTPIEVADTQIFLLPYFEPFAAQQYFHDESLQHLDQAVAAVITQMKTLFTPGKRHILVAHFFVSGSLQTDSETQLTVGGLAAVPLDLLADFDYVALGHLHGKDALQAQNACYSGSPVKFSLSEAKQNKGVYIIDTETLTRTFHPLTPLRDVQQITASFAELTNPQFYQAQKQDDYIGVTLTDKKPIPNVLTQLRQLYPNLISLTRAEGFEAQFAYQGENGQQLRHKDPLELLADFYEQVAQEELTDQQRQWAAAALKIANKEEQ